MLKSIWQKLVHWGVIAINFLLILVFWGILFPIAWIWETWLRFTIAVLVIAILTFTGIKMWTGDWQPFNFANDVSQSQPQQLGETADEVAPPQSPMATPAARVVTFNAKADDTIVYIGGQEYGKIRAADTFTATGWSEDQHWIQFSYLGVDGYWVLKSDVVLIGPLDSLPVVIIYKDDIDATATAVKTTAPPQVPTAPATPSPVPPTPTETATATSTPTPIPPIPTATVITSAQMTSESPGADDEVSVEITVE